MWQAILGFFSGLPKLVDFFKQLFSYIANAYRNYQILKKNDEMRKATEKAKSEKNTSDIDDLFGGRK